MRILAIDPGTNESAYVVWDTLSRQVFDKGWQNNSDLLWKITHWNETEDGVFPNVCAIEMIASYGMPVGRETFETCLWIGQFMRQWYLSSAEYDYAKPSAMLVYRKDVKMHLCNSTRAKDGNVRQAIIDLLGPPGTKKNPGKTYGISKHTWSALAVALTAEHQINTALCQTPTKSS